MCSQLVQLDCKMHATELQPLLHEVSSQKRLRELLETCAGDHLVAMLIRAAMHALLSFDVDLIRRLMPTGAIEAIPH